MEARQCDVCNEFYVDKLESKMQFQIPTDIQVKGSRGPVTMNVQLLPYIAVPGQAEKSVDLCPSCKRWVAEQAARSLLQRATKQLWVTPQPGTSPS